MGTRSFFVKPEAMADGRVELHGSVAHQIRNVLRLQPGDTIDLLDSSGYVQVARIVKSSRESVRAEIVERRRSTAEPSVDLRLYQALLKGDKMEMVLQKGTEIGVSGFVPVLSERCVSRPSASDLQRRRVRWSTIVREAAEQSGRALLPTVAPLESFDAACRSMSRSDLALMAWEGERESGLRQAVREAVGPGAPASCLPESCADYAGLQRPRIALLVGPEGGFSQGEARTAGEMGIRIVGLGPRTLRAETAALVAAALVLGETGDLDG